MDFAPTRQDYLQQSHSDDSWPDLVHDALDEIAIQIDWLKSEEGRIAAMEDFMQAGEDHGAFEPDLIDTDAKMREHLAKFVNYLSIARVRSSR